MDSGNFPDFLDTTVRRSKSGKATRVFHEDGSSEFYFSNEKETQDELVEFYEKHGRDLTEHDMSRIVEALMDETDVHPSLRYAWEVTGRIVTEENRTLLTPTELAEWYCVIHDWERDHPDELSLDDLALDDDVAEGLHDAIANYDHLRTVVPADDPISHVTLDVLHIATTLMAGKAPVSAYMLSNLAFRTSPPQIDMFVMVGGSLAKASLDSGAFQRDPELVDTVSRIAETFNVDTEAVRLLNSIDMADDRFTITGDNFTIAATVASVIAGMLACDVLPEHAVMAMLDTEDDHPDDTTDDTPDE
jgi:hypothetical protein